MNSSCFSYLWCLSTLLVLSSFCVTTTKAHGLRLRKFVSSASATPPTTATSSRSLAEEEQQEEAVTTHNNQGGETNHTKTITIPILYNLQFFEEESGSSIPEGGPSPQEIQGLLKATEKFYTDQMKMDTTVFANDFVSFQMVEDSHRLVLAGNSTVVPNNGQQQQQSTDTTTTLKLVVYAKVELVSTSELTEEQTARAMPSYDLNHLITRYVWKADPQDGDPDSDADDAFKNLFRQTHWVEIIATHMG